jgi:hypothetical protein
MQNIHNTAPNHKLHPIEVDRLEDIHRTCAGMYAKKITDFLEDEVNGGKYGDSACSVNVPFETLCVAMANHIINAGGFWDHCGPGGWPRPTSILERKALAVEALTKTIDQILHFESQTAPRVHSAVSYTGRAH